ncbi:MAG TPA: formate/nitrite transporter family protein [Candidatus Saccharimonadales bacterium]|nr:formate/nitrite transporter family protein [Candidatus Saccharimonadales bacterium]
MTKASAKSKSIVDDPESPITTRAEERQVEQRAAIGAAVVYETVRLEGEDELVRPLSALAWSGLAAGLSIGFSLLAEAFLTAHLPDAPWRPLIARSGYCLGFLIVILGRQQLFTENTLTVVLPLLLHKDAKTFLHVARLWTIVLSANLLGTAIFGLVIARIPIFDPAIEKSIADIAAAHWGLGFGTIFLRAVFAGWLIALMVWMLPGADSSRVAIIIIVTYVIGIGSLSHIIAGSTNIFYLVASGHVSLLRYFTNFFTPALLGNIIGGVSLVAALAHGQVIGGKK